MLNSLSYNVLFPSTGRRLGADIDFSRGFGSITGPNEAGKTFVIEMVRYCLFGTKALRHNADSYQNLTAVLNFTVRGETYTVHRDRKPRLLLGEDVIAVGTSPINEKITSILGYGLDVFDVANVANQGDLEKLGQMRPADRKRMVDNVIGLGVIEDLTKWCGDQANGFNREADAIASTLREPVEPTKPERIVKREEVEQLQVLKSELDRIDGWLSVDRKEPAVVEKPNIDEQVELLDKATQEGRDEAELQQLRRILKTLPAPAAHSDEELAEMLALYDKADVWEEWSRERWRELSVEEIKDGCAAWALIEKHDDQDHILHQLGKQGHHTCPSCAHQFPADPDRVEALKAKLVDLPPRPAKPKLTLQQLLFQEALREAPPKPEQVERPALSRKQIVAAQMANQKAAERTQVEVRIAELGDVTTHWRDAYRKSVERVRDHAAFVKEMDVFLEWAKEREGKLVRAKELREATTGLPELQRLLSLSEAYERDMLAHLRDVSNHARLMVQVEDLRSKVDGWRRARAALTTLRLLVKQHLLPSLNKVASHLLVGMTGGQRSSIVVDDDFEVMVDGQPLDTLSGSGKSVANLALRLGLGQVLTNNVFSVFVGDEIDAFMDADRAENTARTLGLLKNSISQILLVTHKYPPADFHIDLGTHEQRQSH